MKKKILLTLVLVMALVLSLSACDLLKGDKAPQSMKVIEGLKTEYELNEVPDFSGVKVLVTYNDESLKEVGASELTFSTLDTSTVGEKKLTITFEDIALDVKVTVKGETLDNEEPVVLSEIKYLSGLPTQIYVNETVDTTNLIVIATYSDGTMATISASALSTNIGELDFTSAGDKTVVIKYQDKTANATIKVVEPQVLRIEVEQGSVNTYVEEGGTLDISGIKVYAIYDNGARVLLSNTDPDLDLTNIPDLSVEGDKDYVITYKTLSTTLKITATPVVLEYITVNLNNVNTAILIGDAFSTAAIGATAHFSNYTTAPVANKDLTFDYDVSAVGTAVVTVTYTLDDVTKADTFEVKVLGIKSITIDTGSISSSVVTDGALDTSSLSVLITAEDDSTYVRNVKTGVTVDTTKLDTSVVGKNGYITASYQGVTSAAVYITVYDEDTNYYITGVALPESLTLFNSNKKYFKNHNYGYVIGDDNNFYFTLILSAYTNDGSKKENITSYTSVSKVYLGDATAPLSGDELAKYVAIDEAKNAFDFTDEAIGKTFTIKTRPRDGVDGYEAEFTRSLTVTVVDGFNVYKSWELNYVTNWSDFDFNDADVYGDEEPRTQVQIVDDYLADTHNATRPENLAGIVLHSDLYIVPDDLPKEYFLDKNRANDFYDYINVFSHMTTASNPHFTIYGNYYTICSNALPTVVAQGYGNQASAAVEPEAVSNAQLFGFSVDPAIKDAEGVNYDHTKYSTTLNSVFLRDDHPNKDELSTAGRDMRGLIGVKTWAQMIYFENARFDAFYISYLADSDYQTVYINESIFYNSWQNHLFIWSDNPFYGGDDDSAFVKENYPTLTVNITNSSITKSGAPVIISQIKQPNLSPNKYCGATINFDFETNDADLWTYVTGTEAWFNSMGAGILTSVASQIKSLNPLLSYYTNGSSFLTNTPPVEGLTGAQFMNIVMVELAAGNNLQETLKGTTDLDGKFIIGDKVLVDMTDTEVAPGLTIGYADVIVGIIKSQYPDAPVFVSSEGGIGVVSMQGEDYILITNVYTMTMAATGLDAATAAALDAQNAKALGYGNYLTLYYNNMAIVLGYNIDDPTRHTLPQQ